MFKSFLLDLSRHRSCPINWEFDPMADSRRDWRCRGARATKCPVTRPIAGGLVILILVMPARTFGQGGPPLITDDPDTPGPGFWEINLAAIVERSLLERRTERPLANINYGVGRRIQLKFEMPWLHVHDRGQPVASGPGNANYGVKWRFLGEEKKRLAWSIYPQLEVNSNVQCVVCCHVT
jgi:hypothetical protein